MMMTHSQCPITHSPFPERDKDEDCYDDEGDDEGDDGDDDDEGDNDDDALAVPHHTLTVS